MIQRIVYHHIGILIFSSLKSIRVNSKYIIIDCPVKYEAKWEDIKYMSAEILR